MSYTTEWLFATNHVLTWEKWPKRTTLRARDPDTGRLVDPPLASTYRGDTASVPTSDHAAHSGPLARPNPSISLSLSGMALQRLCRVPAGNKN